MRRRGSFVCICPFCFVPVGDMRIHYYSEHFKNAILRCSTCSEFACDRVEEMLEHEMRVHWGWDDYTVEENLWLIGLWDDVEPAPEPAFGCGGIFVSAEDIERTVTKIFEENKLTILEQRYRTNVGSLIEHVLKRHPWADKLIVKELVDTKLYELLGEKTAADNEKPSKKKEKPAKVVEINVANAPPPQPTDEELNPFLRFPQPEENFKLNRLVMEKWVDGWDDPRLLTPAGLRRRGVTPTSINAFVRGVGITKSDCSMISLSRLEYHIREELNKIAPRTMVVIHPLKVVVTNLEAGSIAMLDARKWPNAQTDDTTASYKVPFSNVLYIEHTDFRLIDSNDYYGLAPGKTVLLRYAYPIKCTEVVFGDNHESVLEIGAEYDPSKTTKPKGVLHWVAEPSPGAKPLKVEVRLFDWLFLSENPSELDENWIDDLNPQSKVVISEAYAVPSLQHAAVGDRFQFERLGYFVADKDTTAEKLVFNRTVTLRDRYGKG